jgi:hypothetical protein
MNNLKKQSKKQCMKTRRTRTSKNEESKITLNKISEVLLHEKHSEQGCLFVLSNFEKG